MLRSPRLAEARTHLASSPAAHSVRAGPSSPGGVKAGKADRVGRVYGQHLALQVPGQLGGFQAEGGEPPPVVVAVGARGGRLVQVNDAPVPGR